MTETSELEKNQDVKMMGHIFMTSLDRVKPDNVAIFQNLLFRLYLTANLSLYSLKMIIDIIK